MEPEPNVRPIRFYEIDLLRFLAAFAVVLYHYTYRGYAESNYSPVPFLVAGRFTRYGYLGVELFFIISGYVVLLSAQGKTVRQFFLSRVTRLYPAFWAACTLTFLAKCLWGPTQAMPMSPNLRVTVLQYLYNLTMFQEFLGIANVDGAYWSLTIEITFYFLVSLLIAYGLMRYLDWFLLAWLAYAALPHRVEGSPFTTLFFPAYAPYFVAGMLFYLLQRPQGRTPLRMALLLCAYLLAIRASLGHAAGMAVFYHADFSRLVVAATITSFFGLFYLVAFRKINLDRFTWLAWLGALTYPLYLLHSDIGFIAFHRLGMVANKYVLLAALIILMLAGAYLLHILVEKRASKPLGVFINRWLTRIPQRA